MQPQFFSFVESFRLIMISTRENIERSLQKDIDDPTADHDTGFLVVFFGLDGLDV